ncbi:MAG TPA: DUF4252 domain-containing protein [Bacteroidales bacterium]|nr:DUF4252 domain-containing protein [Bacteroidales bacterium]
MKKLILILVTLLSAVVLHAQTSALDKLFEKYSGAEGFTTVYISKAMFQMFASLDTSTDGRDDMQKTIHGLTGIRILAVEDPDKIPQGFNLYNAVMNATKNFHYEELMVVKQEGKDVKFLIQKNGAKIGELLLLVGGTDENVAISIQGDIDLKNISNLSNMMNIQEMNELDNIK